MMNKLYHKCPTGSGCSVSLVGSNAALGGSPSPIDQWREQFAARGWQEDVNHRESQSDGPDERSGCVEAISVDVQLPQDAC
jgi:hypothetical protein